MRDQEHFTVTGAARTLGIPASSVSGEGAMLSRYIRGGLAGLERHGGAAGAGSLSRRIEALGWFIPAAQFFFLSAKGKRRPLAKAIRRAAALPDLPRGWHKDTVSRFLARLNLEALPQCPADLQEELTKRQRDGKAIAPPRIMRFIKASPSSIRRHCIEGPVEELAQINFQAIATRLAALEPGASCRAIIELV